MGNVPRHDFYKSALNREIGPLIRSSIETRLLCESTTKQKVRNSEILIVDKSRSSAAVKEQNFFSRHHHQLHIISIFESIGSRQIHVILRLNLIKINHQHLTDFTEINSRFENLI